jgi:hypothetical protein
VASNVRLVIHGHRFPEIMKSGGAQSVVRSKAQSIASAAGEGHKVVSEVGARRARAAVITATWRARYEQGRNKRLTRAVGAGRG